MFSKFTRPVLIVLAICALAVTASACGTKKANPVTTADKKLDKAMPTTTTSAAPDIGGTLVGNVGAGGDAFQITLKQGGNDVTTLKPGAYTINVSDDSATHDFHLTGPGVDEATTVPGTGAKVWKVTLKAGTYKFVCDPHASSMNGSFTVA